MEDEDDESVRDIQNKINNEDKNKKCKNPPIIIFGKNVLRVQNLCNELIESKKI